MRTRSPDAAYAALAQLEWGKWTSRRAFDHNVAFDLTTWRSGMPYIVGHPTLDADLPVSGTMTYALAGATKAIDMTTGAVGTLSGSLSIAFQNAQYSVTPNASIAMPGQTYVTGSGTTRIGPDGARGTFCTMTQNVSGGACAGSACTFSTQGVLTGTAANNAGIVYSQTGPEARVIGAAGFKRRFRCRLAIRSHRSRYRSVESGLSRVTPSQLITLVRSSRESASRTQAANHRCSPAGHPASPEPVSAA